MCLVTGCANPGTAASINAGLGPLGLCAGDFATVRLLVVLRLPNGGVGVDPLFIDDCVFLKVLMRYGQAIVHRCWHELDTELSSAKLQQGMFPMPHDERFDNPKGYANYVRLSRALEYYEGLCWFPVNRITFPGALQPAEFLDSLEWGFAKDPGAGSQHGDLSHRFQWHAVMRVITNGFTIARRVGWNKSPLQLYLRMFDPGSSVWAYLFDMPGLGAEGYSHPDNVLAGLRLGGAPGQNWPLILPNLQRRAQKRDDFDQAITNAINSFLPAERTPGNDGTVGALRKTLYEWKKRGGPPAIARRTQADQQQHRRMDAATFAIEVWHHVQQSHQALLANHGQLNAVHGAPNVLTSTPPQTPLQRVDNFALLNSTAQLNTVPYTYNAQRGAYKT